MPSHIQIFQAEFHDLGIRCILHVDKIRDASNRSNIATVSEQGDNTVVGTCLENVHKSHNEGMVGAVKSLQQLPSTDSTTHLPWNVTNIILLYQGLEVQRACASRTAYLVVRSCNESNYIAPGTQTTAEA